MTEGILGGIEFAYQYATRKGQWVVIVVPDSVFPEARAIFAAMAPEDRPFSGRTAVTGKGRVSLTLAGQGVFIPNGRKFSVIFLGWEHKAEDAAEMKAWREAAQETLCW